MHLKSGALFMCYFTSSVTYETKRLLQRASVKWIIFSNDEDYIHNEQCALVGPREAR